jgi:hypothetical protein
VTISNPSGRAEMKLLSNRSGTYLTGNEIADAVMHYALLLTRGRQVDTVNIPFLAAEGGVSRVELVIGWLIDTASVGREGVSDELVEIDTILGIYSRAEALSTIKAQGFTKQELDELQWPLFGDEAF